MLIIDSKMLTWNPETKTFTVEASDLEAVVKDNPQYRDRIMQVNGRWASLCAALAPATRSGLRGTGSSATGKVCWRAWCMLHLGCKTCS